MDNLPSTAQHNQSVDMDTHGCLLAKGLNWVILIPVSKMYLNHKIFFNLDQTMEEELSQISSNT